jgi:Fe-S-cluster containining protein
MSTATRLPSPCDGCDARCCRSYTVHVSGADAHRIATGVPLDMIRFLGCVPEVERSETGFLLQPGGRTFSLVLATVRTHDPRSPCIFLRVNEETGEGRCGIYPFRPDACRRFPAYRRDDGSIAAREEVACPEGAWVGHPMDRLSWRVALAREERDLELYAVVVAEWNARIEAARERPARTIAEYLDHVSDAYGWITRMRRTLPPRESAGPGLLLRVGEALRKFPGA